MNKCAVYAGVVSYNPDIKRLKENITAIHTQVPNVIIFDNGSNNITFIEETISAFNNVKLIKSDKNIGIAAALNRLMQWGYNYGFDWMLSLDQDSVCDSTYVKIMIPYLTVKPNLGIVAPVIVDRNVGIIGHNPQNDYSYVNTCITSGSFSKIQAWKAIGEYDENLFIDSVDFEFCYRMRKSGYGVIQVKNVRLLHEIGKSQQRIFLLWKITVNGHSAFRKYYIARNNIYYPLKHHLWLYLIRGNLRNLGLILTVGLYENEKWEKIKAIYKGWMDAYTMRSKKNGN